MSGMSPERSPLPSSGIISDHGEELDNILKPTPVFFLSLGHTPTHDSDVSPPFYSQIEIHDESPTIVAFGQGPDGVEDDTDDMPTDLYLFDHYMTHASGCSASFPIDSYGLKIGLPGLAAEHKGILCSLMALGAACLCIDVLQGRETWNHGGGISELISKGDWYHQKGLQSVRSRMNNSTQSNLEIAHIHTAVLLPYALARRRISRLLSKSENSYLSSDFDTRLDTPNNMEWLVLLRGIGTTGMACWSNELTPANNPSEAKGCQSEKTSASISSHIGQAMSENGDLGRSYLRSLSPALGSRHSLFPIISATRVSALAALQGKADRLNQTARSLHRKELPQMSSAKASAQLVQSASIAACSIAIDILAGIGDMIFTDPPETSLEQILTEMSPTGIESPTAPSSWIKKYIGKPPVFHPALPLRRVILAWVSRLPSEFVDLFMHPLQVHDCANTEDQSQPLDLDQEIKLLAWDIYAHWLVFAILIEDETWWLADLGVADLANLRDLLGKPTASSLMRRNMSEECRDWWPRNMCSIAQQLKEYEHGGNKG